MSLRWRLFLAALGGFSTGVFGTIMGLLRLAKSSDLPMVLSAVGLAAGLLLCLVVSWGASKQFSPCPAVMPTVPSGGVAHLRETD